MIVKLGNVYLGVCRNNSTPETNNANRESEKQKLHASVLKNSRGPFTMRWCLCVKPDDQSLNTDYQSLITISQRGVGRGCGVGRDLGVEVGLGPGVGVGVAVGVTLGVGVGLGVGVTAGPSCTSKEPISMRSFFRR
jgi:hypothetical protein